MGQARARMKLSANVTEEQDWYLDTPDVRLTRIFAVVILLHVIAVGGIFAFKMVDKASDASAVKISTAHRDFDSAVQEARETAAAVPAAAPIVEALKQVDAPAATGLARSLQVGQLAASAAMLHAQGLMSEEEAVAALASQLPEHVATWLWKRMSQADAAQE